MLKLKNISNTFLLILLMGSIHAFGQDPFIVFGQDISNNDTMRYISKAPHWQGVSKLTKLNYLQAQRKQFKASAYVETYVEAVLDHPSWMFTMFNQFAALGKGLRNTPHIIFHVRYKPLNDQLTSYQVSVTVSGSAELTLNFNAITQGANFLGLNGRTFPTPQDASDEVEQAIQEAMRLISREVGNTLSPELMVKYKNEVFWNGHEILIGKEGDNQITLQPLGKFGKPLSPEQVSWTNASNGVVDMTGLQNKSITLTRLDTAVSLTVNIKRRSSFVLDTKTLLRPIVLQVLEERLAAVLDELVNTRIDSVSNANSVASLVGQVEAGNVSLEGSEVLVPLFAQPLVLADSTGFKRNDTGIKARTLRELRKSKAIRQVLRTKVNTRAFCNLVIQKPDKLDELMDELLLNSGTLLGEIVLNLGDPAMLQSARNIIITYLNENMTRLAGSNFGMANDEPITVRRVQSAAPAVVFDPAKRLYINNPNVDFPGKSEFIRELTSYLNSLETPLYVFINYSQDVSTETYLKRTIGTRPTGLPEDAQFVTLTLVNIPGSVQYQMFGSKAGVQVNTSLPAKDFLLDYVMANFGCDVIRPTGTGKEGELRIVNGVNPRGRPCETRYLYHEGKAELLFENKGWYEEAEYFDKVREVIQAICWLQRDLFYPGGGEQIIEMGLEADAANQQTIETFISHHTLDDHFHENIQREVLNFGQSYLDSRFGTGRVDPVQIEIEVVLFITTGGLSATRKAVDALRSIVRRSADRLAKRLLAKGGAKTFSSQIDDAISRLRSASKYELDNTGRYGDVLGHHPLAKSAFRDNFPTEAAFKQYYDDAFSVSIPQLEKFGGKGIHAKITGQQNSLYTSWRKANPTARMTIDDMANIEIQAMVSKGIPQDVATGWVVKALEKLKAQGITDISNIPWNGVN